MLLIITVSNMLNFGTAMAQSRFSFKLMYDTLYPTYAKKELVNISAVLDTSQRDEGSGINFALIVENKSERAIKIKNIADQLSISLFNSLGFDVAVFNSAFRSQPSSFKMAIPFRNCRGWQGLC